MFLHLYYQINVFCKSSSQTAYYSSGVLNGVSDDSTSSDDDETDESDEEEKLELQFGKFFPGKVKGLTKKGNNVLFIVFLFIHFILPLNQIGLVNNMEHFSSLMS